MSVDHLILCSDRSHTFATLGAMHTYYIKGDLDSVKKYSCCGSSVVVALLLSCGTPPSQIAPTLISSSIFENSSETEQEITLLLKKFFRRKNIPVPTLRGLHELTGKTLFLEAYNVTKRRPEVISHVTHPSISCVAVCCLAYNAPFSGNRLSYCGSEYIDSSYMYSIPHSSVASNDIALCMYASPDLMSVSTFSLCSDQKTTSKSWWPWDNEGSADTISALEKQADRDLKSSSLMYQRMLQISEDLGPKNIKYVRLLVNSPNTTASPEQRLSMLADWEDYLAINMST